MTLSEAERAELIEELASARHGHGLPPEATHRASRRSRTCGDAYEVGLVMEGDRVIRLGWEGHGCVVSTAAASTLASLAPGRTAEELRDLVARHLAAVEPGAEPDPLLGEDAALFAGIGRLPLRAGCATIAWRAALDALA